MRPALLLAATTLLMALSTGASASASTCDAKPCPWLETSVPPFVGYGCGGLGLAIPAVCDQVERAIEDEVGPLVEAGPGRGDCQGPIRWGGPVACNVMTQFLCSDSYNEGCADAARQCRGPDGHVRSDMDGDRDGECDSADVDDDNDGVPDECDDHPNNQDIVQETVDYVDYYVFDGSHC